MAESPGRTALGAVGAPCRDAAPQPGPQERPCSRDHAVTFADCSSAALPVLGPMSSSTLDLVLAVTVNTVKVFVSESSILPIFPHELYFEHTL